MSNPIGPQPGGYSGSPGSNYGNVPPRKTGVTGWKVAGFGCLGLFLLAAVGVVMLGLAARNQYRHPSKSTIVGLTLMVAKATMEGQNLQLAVVAYHKEKGQYPQTLEQLVSEDRIDGKTLHNDLDDHPSPGHVSWLYIKPAEGAPGGTPILEEPYQATIGSKTASSHIVITLDGKSRDDGSTAPAPEGQTP